MNTLNVDEILKRIRLIFNVSTNKELSSHLNISQQALSGWVSRNVIPLDTLLDVAERKNVSIDWLVYGKQNTPELSTHEKMALLAFNDLDDRQKIEALAMMGQLGKGTPLTGNISQTAGDSGMNNVAGGDINMNKDTANYAPLSDFDNFLKHTPGAKEILDINNMMNAIYPKELKKLNQILKTVQVEKLPKKKIESLYALSFSEGYKAFIDSEADEIKETKSLVLPIFNSIKEKYADTDLKTISVSTLNAMANIVTVFDFLKIITEFFIK